MKKYILLLLTASLLLIASGCKENPAATSSNPDGGLDSAETTQTSEIFEGSTTESRGDGETADSTAESVAGVTDNSGNSAADSGVLGETLSQAGNPSVPENVTTDSPNVTPGLPDNATPDSPDAVKSPIQLPKQPSVTPKSSDRTPKSPVTTPQFVEKTTPKPQTQPPAPPKSVGYLPYKFSAKDLQGNSVTEKSLGEKEIFFVHYWATWCGPCVSEMADLAKIARDYGDRAGFIGLVDDYSSNLSSAVNITTSSNIPDFFIMIDANNSSAAELRKLVNSGYLPTTVIINAETGKVSKQLVGSMGKGYTKEIDSFLS